jgi:3-isopropylmalate/(R)-2-methylmalate dehydratase small subunit
MSREPFRRVEAVAAPLDTPNLDTDRIVPARFLRQPRAGGFGRFLFHDLRLGPDGREDPRFVLNQPAYRAAGILVAAENFGCGSSREGAVWALADHGFRAVIAPSFADIFAGNALHNGLLPVTLPGPVVARMREALRERPGATVAVDLEALTVRDPDGRSHAFTVDAFARECLLAGRDEIDLTLAHQAEIAAFEARRAAALPWLDRPGPGAKKLGPRPGADIA